MTKTYWMAAALIVGLSVVGCGGGDDDNGDGSGSGGESATGGGSNGSGGGDDTRTGVTSCGDFPDGPKSCQAGQYCEDDRISQCSNGCLSDNNCAGNQTCVKEGSNNIGACQNNATSTDCDTLCTKLLTCDPEGTQEECNQFCAGTNAECHSCIQGANCGTLFEDCAEACGF